MIWFANSRRVISRFAVNRKVLPSLTQSQREERHQHEEWSTPETIRTSDTRLRRPLLYPAELRGHGMREDYSEF